MSGNPNDPTAKYYDIVYSELKSGEVVNEEISLIQSLVTHGSKILDVGAGTGRHAIPLAGLGYKITAIEPSQGMSKVAAEKISKNHIQNLEWIFADIYDFSSDKKFDLIILMWNTFNEIALSKDAAERLLAKLQSLLFSNGKILINIDNSEIIDLPNIDQITTVKKDNINYKSTWEVKQYDTISNTTISTELIEVSENNKLLDSKSTEISQKWWSGEEITKIATNKGMNINFHEIKNNQELYLTLTPTAK